MLAKSAALAVMSVLLATAGQLLLKAGMERVGYVGGTRLSQPIPLFLTVVRTPQVLAGLGLFGISALFWLIVLSRVPLSFAYPFAGLTYVMTTTFARYVLNEHVPGMRWFGIVLILAGVVMVGRTAPPGIQ